MEALKVDIVSPLGQLISNRMVSVLRVPSVNGEITVLPGHIDIISLLGTGCLRLDNDPPLIVYKGFIQISGGDTVVISAERITMSSDLNKQTLISSIRAVEDRLLKEQLEDKDFDLLLHKYNDLLAELSSFN